MANRRCLHALTRHASALFSTNPCLPSLPLAKTQPLKPFLAAHIFTTLEDDDDDEVGGSSEEDELELVKRVLSGEERGRGEPSDRVFKPYGPVFCCRSGSSSSSFGVVFHWMFMGVLIFCYLFVFRLDRTSSR
ncbi:hypothetical protein CFP56_041677 [Quercus suber]|uniref:Uncharacterized protein n=1 Tax=Quercus suber TaxID=58331 RepID=A0AAW0LJ39_QUESU